MRLENTKPEVTRHSAQDLWRNYALKCRLAQAFDQLASLLRVILTGQLFLSRYTILLYLSISLAGLDNNPLFGISIANNKISSLGASPLPSRPAHKFLVPKNPIALEAPLT